MKLKFQKGQYLNNRLVLNVSKQFYTLPNVFQSLITINNQKLDSLSNLETQKEKDIDVLKSQLSGLSNKNKDLKKKYDAEVALVNSMSNDNIVDVFTETFK